MSRQSWLWLLQLFPEVSWAGWRRGAGRWAAGRTGRELLWGMEGRASLVIGSTGRRCNWRDIWCNWTFWRNGCGKLTVSSDFCHRYKVWSSVRYVWQVRCFLMYFSTTPHQLIWLSTSKFQGYTIYQLINPKCVHGNRILTPWTVDTRQAGRQK